MVAPTNRRNIIRAFFEHAKINNKLQKLSTRINKLGPASNWTGTHRRIYRRIQEVSGHLLRRKTILSHRIRYHKFENLIREEALWRQTARLLRRHIPLVGETFRNIGRVHEQKRAMENFEKLKRNMASPSRGLTPTRMRGPSPSRTSTPTTRHYSPRRPVPHRVPSGPAHAAITWTRGPNGKVNVHKTLAN
jgi:hypothetical protein